jgi:hypothetical protein
MPQNESQGLIVKRPNQIYHVWHYCPKCRKVFDHSQGTWNEYKGEHCGVEWKDVSTKIESLTIEIRGKEGA